MDIVPTLAQFRAFANPVASAAYYHWPFLAVPTAPAMIEAMTGRYWCETNLQRTRGGNSAGVAKFRENDAVEHYCRLFDLPECISGSCADYAAGATTDVEAQESDQKAGRKVKCPLLVMYSAGNLGRMHDVEGVWKEWVDGEVEFVGVGDGYGHFLPEECPEIVAEHVLKWIEKDPK